MARASGTTAENHRFITGCSSADGLTGGGKINDGTNVTLTRSAYYVRLPQLLDDLSIGRADACYMNLLKQLSRIDVLVIDDWGLAVLDDAHLREVQEVLDDRHGSRSTNVTSQLPIEHWHAAIGDATSADAILDRLVHNAHRLNLKGNSLRKKRANSTSSPRLE